MKIVVHIRGQVHHVQCAEGQQNVLWLGHVALTRIDNSFGVSLGPPLAITTEEGVEYPMDKKIADVLKDGEHVWVVLAEDTDL
jgi:hypothetical protein